MRTVRLLALVCLALLAPAAAGAQVGELRERAAEQRAQERRLGGAAARIGALVARVERQLSTIERRRGAVQAELAADEARLARTRARLRAERVRLARLRARLAEARAALRDRLVALYKTTEPDLATVALSANGLTEIVERTAFLERVRDQDERIVTLVRDARRDAKSGVERLAADERSEQDAVAAIRARRDALTRMAEGAAERRATLARARVVRLAAVASTRARRRGVQRRIASLERAEERRVARARAQASIDPGPRESAAPGGGWAIPAAIVECESGGQNLPPNGAGASGYYQIVPGTWRQYGGRGPAAWRASKAEQDRVAARIWNGGAGASQWVCSLLG